MSSDSHIFKLHAESELLETQLWYAVYWTYAVYQTITSKHEVILDIVF